MSRSCARLIVPTFVRLGSPDPLSSPIACLIRTAAGGVFVMKVNERSSKTVISTGMIVPPVSPWVWALKALQNSMMFTPCWPRAGPTGGAGLAAPAGTWSLMRPVTFFAIVRPQSLHPRLEAAELRVIQLDGGGPPEKRDLYLHLALVMVDVLNRAAE